MWLFRVLLSTIFLLSVVLSIPIAFDVGGRDAGLAYSLALFTYYGAASTIKIAVRLFVPSDRSSSQRLRWSVSAALRLSQWIVIPALLIWALTRFSVDASSTDWVARTVAHVTGGEGAAAAASSTGSAATDAAKGGFGLSGFFGLGDSSSSSGGASSSVFSSPPPLGSGWNDWLFGRGGIVESAALGSWDKVLRYSSPIFQVLEGFCTLLVIQAAGQITRWLVNRGRSDTWLIILVVFSGSVMASAIYFLSRIARFPQIDNIDAILIGVTITSAVFLSAYGIGSGRGNPVESSLLFAYIVLCVYQIFTDYQPSSPEAAARRLQQQEEQAAALEPEFPPLPPIIMASYSTLVHLLSTLPSVFSSALRFLHAAFQTITPSVIISLTYRIIVFYCATRIIPAVRESGARALLQEPSLEDSDAASKLLGFLSWYSASILIAIYTSLLLQHFSVSNAVGNAAGWTLRAGEYIGGTTTRWFNVVGVMLLYAIELYIGSDDLDGGLTNHWKME